MPHWKHGKGQNREQNEREYDEKKFVVERYRKEQRVRNKQAKEVKDCIDRAANYNLSYVRYAMLILGNFSAQNTFSFLPVPPRSRRQTANGMIRIPDIN